MKAVLALLVLALALSGAAVAQALPAPVVVVYPLAAGNGSVDQTGENLATAISTKLVTLGGLDVKPFVPGTTRTGYLDAALKIGADYYITGYLTPLGNELSLVEQVVSTHSGTIVYSTTTLARTYNDAVGPADQLRSAILHHAGRGLAQLDAPAPSPTPEVVGQNGGINITHALRHHKKDAATAAPSASAAPGAPTVATVGRPAARLALVLPTSGTADAPARARATAALATTLKARGIASAMLSVTAADVAAHASDLCRANAGTQGFYAGSLAVATAASARATVTLDLSLLGCDARVLGRQHVAVPVGRGGLDRTIDDAVARATAALVAPAATPAVRPAAS